MPITGVLIGFAVVLAGCTAAPSHSGHGGDTTPAPAASSDPGMPTGDLVEFTVDVEETGFNGQPQLQLTVKQGDKVKITFRHREPYNDFHPIAVTCKGQVANVEANGQASVTFVADKAGTCAFFCTNTDCAIHDALQGGKVVVEA